MIIKVDEKKLGSLLSGDETVYQVPEYQREYSWGKSQLEDLWNDLWEERAELEKDEHFMGSIVVINTTHTSGIYNKSDVVDGQQRLVTFSLLIIALRNKYKYLSESSLNQSEENLLWKKINDRYLVCEILGLEKKTN